jgi:membrane-bound serine protease (ClpP class)
MEILTNPNIVYLELVVGFLMAILALLTPGTGIIELGALFILILSGWGVFTNAELLNYWALVILVLGVLPFFWALRKSQKTVYLVIAMLAFVLGSAYLFRGETWRMPGINPILAPVVSVLVVGFLWILTQKVLEAERSRPSHDLQALIGETGEAKTDIREGGSVQVAGELWSARSNQPIPRGAEVRVVGREGFILLVEGTKTSTQ